MKQYLRWNGKGQGDFDGVCSDGRPIRVDAMQILDECEEQKLDSKTVFDASLTDDACLYPVLDPDAYQPYVDNRWIYFTKDGRITPQTLSSLENRINHCQEIREFLPDGRRCVIKHERDWSGTHIWDCWIYNDPKGIIWSIHWTKQTLDELIQTGRTYYGVDLFQISPEGG